jgi:two-component system, OmpR family, phosphate regulon sensor histidine kinase PhoR
MLAMKRNVFLCWAGRKVARRLIYKFGFALAAAVLTGIISTRFDFSVFQIGALIVAVFVISLPVSGWLVPLAKSDTKAAQPPSTNALSAPDVLNVFPNPAIVFSAQGLALIVNPAAKQAFRGLDVGIGFNQWFRDAAILDAFAKVKANGKPASVELVEKRPLERAFRVEIASIDPATSAILMVFTEHTEALRVDRMRADFIANASHELRTPLTAVTGFLETLQGPARNDVVNRERFIVLMLEQTQRMARLIDDLLSLSRFETQSTPGKMQQVDLGLLAGTTIDALAGLATSHKVQIDNLLEAGAVIVDGDPDELTQVLQNLIENAVKYGATGGRIEIGAAKPNPREKGFFVRDFGAGIPSEHIPRLTERFYRVDVEASRQQKGTGLGLAIVKHILTRHRARLLIESRQGEGSTFSVLFPNAG